MRRDFEVFEKFPDGSTLWRACVSGRFEAQRKVQELAERSDNEFFIIDIQAVEILLPKSIHSTSQAQLKRAAAAG